jgi:two-component system, NtrC family, response regulator AtoC
MHTRLAVIAASSDDVVTTRCTSVFEAEGHSYQTIIDPQKILLLLRDEHSCDVLLVDMELPSLRTGRFLEEVASKMDVSRLWIISPMGTTYWRNDAERLGIRNVIWKPVQRHDFEQVLETVSVHKATRLPAPAVSQISSKRHDTPCYIEDLPGGRYFLAACPAMMKLYETVCLLAAVDVPVLILGESGVGKDVVAALLHKHSLRSSACYSSLNCAALPPDLLESELFGYEAGAFTGAIKAKAGKFELADHGTLLLDEIGEMSAPMQAKLLHVLQDGRYSRLGARTESHVDVRVIAATNVDIETAIAQNAFREDLYYRISAFTIEIPPLRERREEIPFLIEQLVLHHAGSLRRDPVYISPEVMTLMMEYRWPGNLRELSNYVIRIQVLGNTDRVKADLEERIRGTRGIHAAPVPVAGDDSQEIAGMRLIVRTQRDRTESRLIQQALEESGWNRRHAAVDLNISYRSLLYKIQQYGLTQNRHHMTQARSA